MSQVRKLLNGNKIEKHQYGHVIIGSNDYDMNDEAVRKDFEEYLAKKGADYGDYLSGVMDMLKSGDSYNGDAIGNTSNYGGPSERTASKLSKKRSNLQMQVDALTNNDVQRYKNAIHYINAYKYNKPEQNVESESKSKSKIDANNIKLDFNTDDSGKYYLSANAGENLSARNRINQIFTHIKSGQDSEFDASDYNTDAISSWINGLDGDDKYLAANNYLDDLWKRMSEIGYNYNQDDIDFLRNFKIVYDLAKPEGSVKPKADNTGKKADSSSIVFNDKPQTEPRTESNQDVVIKPTKKLMPQVPREEMEINIPDIKEENFHKNVKLKPIVQLIPIPDGEEKTIKINTRPNIGSGVTNYKEVYQDFTGNHIGNFKTNTNNYKIFRDKDGKYVFVSAIGNYPRDLYHGKEISEDLIRQLLSGNIPKDFEKHLRSSNKFVYKGTSNKSGNIVNFINELQLSTPVGRILAGVNPDPIGQFFKKGGILKAQRGLPKIQFNKVYNPVLKDNYDTQLMNYRVPNGFGKDYSTLQNNNLVTKSTLKTASNSNQNTISNNTNGTNDTNDTKYGRWGLDAPSLYRYVDPLLGMIQFGAVAGFQNKGRDLGKAAVEAGRYQLQAPTFSQYRTDSPALQQQRNYLMSLQQSGIKPVTSDVTQYYASNLTNQANLRQQLAQNTAQQSEFEWQANKENAAIANQNLQNQISVANQNRQINAAINSALYNPDLQLNAERKQSFENKMLELRNKVNKQTNILNQMQYSAEAKKIQDAYEKAVSDYVGSDIYNKWTNLGESGQSQYTDFKDYLYKNYKSNWEANNWGKWFDDRDAQLARDLQNAQYGILVNPFLRRLLGTFHEANRHNEIYKKGGYLRGTTRYTMEPDERIWVENNNATHKAVAKLSDNTIKLLLRALK